MPKLKLCVQYATNQDSGLASSQANLPSRSQLRKWAQAAINVDTELTIRIVDAQEGLELNSNYRGKDYTTNVLTFPISETPHLLGDIIICAPVVADEASMQHKSMLAHYAHLTVHGVLHLQGFDHETEAQAELMEGLEITILAKLGYANPYLVT
jgi:probable rRNA maturation factor